MIITKNIRLSRTLKVTWKNDLFIIISCTLAYFANEYVFRDYFDVPAIIATVLGTALAFFIGFNNNQSYGVKSKQSQIRMIIQDTKVKVNGVKSLLTKSSVSMKTSFFYSLSTLFVAILICSFTIYPFKDFALNIKVEGQESKNIFQEGLQPSELALMTIESTDEKISIKEFEVILARGTRPVAIKSVNGNQYDLANFADQAKSGDRIVIEITKFSDADAPEDLAFATFPIR